MCIFNSAFRERIATSGNIFAIPMKQIALAFLLLMGVTYAYGQSQAGNPKVILITLDGFRWQEMFSGADSLLVAHPEYVKDSLGLKAAFWNYSPILRRKALMPFIWNQVAGMGEIHGNRQLGSKVDLTNRLWFSYPGYSEILTGKADDSRINSNDKMDNPNSTVLEIAQNTSLYKEKVAAFGSWDVFPYIINRDRSGIVVNAGFEKAAGTALSEREKFLNDLQDRIPSPWTSVRFDAFTHYYALEHMQKQHPALVYIAFGETDDFAHDGNYEGYLKAAHNTDQLIKEIWEYTQKDPFYKDQTLFIITTDHGRGTQPLSAWKDHGEKVMGAGNVWMILFGKTAVTKGEVKISEQLYSNQIAPTILSVMGLPPLPDQMPGEALPHQPD